MWKNIKNMFNLSKKTWFVTKVGISLAFIAWLVYKVKWAEVWEHVRHVRLEYLAWYIVFVLVGMMFSAKKWQIIAKFKGFQRSLFGCFRAYLTGTFINNFLPGFIGGDAYRSYWLGRQREGYTAAVSTVIFDRFSGLVSAALLAVGFSLMRYDEMIGSTIWTSLVVTLIVVVIGVTFWGSVWKQIGDSVAMQSLARFLPRKIRLFLDEVRDYFRFSIIAPSIAFSVLFNLFGVGIANLLLFHAFGQAVSVIDFFAVIFLISIVSSVPVSVNNIGIKEWAYYTFFALIAVDPEAAVTVAIVGRFLQMLLSFFAFPDFLRRKQLDSELA